MMRRLNVTPFAVASLLLGLTLSSAVSAQTAPTVSRPADLPDAQKVIDAAIDAMGGEERLKAIKSRYMKATMVAPMGQMSMETYYGPDGKFLVSRDIGMAVIKCGSDGTVTWIQNPMSGGYELLEGKDAEAARGEANMLDQLINIRKEYPTIETVGQADFGGKPCHKLKLTNKDGEVQHGFFNIDTKYIAGLEISQDSPQGPMNVSIEFLDWKKFGEIMLYTKMKVEQMGMAIDVTVDKFELDKVDPTVFELPAEVRDLAKSKATSRPAVPSEGG